MALLRIGKFNLGGRNTAQLSNYDDEEPYMPGGSYAGDGYADGGDYGYDDDRYADDYYADEGYDDEYYDDDDYYDDGYGNEYYDDGGDPYYDDPGYDDGYDQAPAYPEGWLGEALRFADDNDWVTWVLLALLPPLGIWLLWRRQRYNRNVTIALTALSALWLALALVLLIAKPFRPRGDAVITPQPVGAATQGMTEEQPEADEQAAEAAAIVTEEEVDDATAVYVLDGQPYYHKQDDCVNIPEGSDLSRISENTAVERSLMACPYCLGSMYSDGQWDLVFVNGDTEDRSNIRVYCSRYNTHFHTDPNCSDLGADGHEVSLKDGLLMSKTSCPVCCPTSAMEVYCTIDGTYYHVKNDCSGMKNASKVTYAEARVIGKKRCPKCIGGTDETETASVDDGSGASGADATYYVYATPKGSYYHIQEHCSGMQNAQRVSLASMLKSGRPACPVCCPDAETVVYAQQGNPYYHSNNTCSGMTNAVQGILVNALAAGLQRCPVCWTTAGTA